MEDDSVSPDFDVVLVGSVVQDLTAYAERFPNPGESIRGTDFQVAFGGKGANQIVEAALLGAKTAMVAKVGADSFGNDAIANFAHHGVNCNFVQTCADAPTATATIIVDTSSGQNSIVVCLGANLCLSIDDVRSAEVYIRRAKVLLCQLEVNPEVSLEALKIAKKHGVTTVFNPAPGLQNLSEEFWKHSDIVCPNENEAEIISGVNPTTDENVEAALSFFLDKGSKIAVVTLGERGCVFATASNRAIRYIPAPKVKCVDSTGAGDAFSGALAFYLACFGHLPIEEMLRRSIVIASYAVQYRGTQSSYLPRDKLPKDLFK